MTLSVLIGPNAFEEARAEVIMSPETRSPGTRGANAEGSKANAFRLHDVFQADDKNARSQRWLVGLAV